MQGESIDVQLVDAATCSECESGVQLVLKTATVGLLSSDHESCRDGSILHSISGMLSSHPMHGHGHNHEHRTRHHSHHGRRRHGHSQHHTNGGRPKNPHFGFQETAGNFDVTQSRRSMEGLGDDEVNVFASTGQRSTIVGIVAGTLTVAFLGVAIWLRVSYVSVRRAERRGERLRQMSDDSEDTYGTGFMSWAGVSEDSGQMKMTTVPEVCSFREFCSAITVLFSSCPVLRMHCFCLW